MPAYVIVEVDVTDPARYDEYKRLSGPAVEAAGGRFIVRGGESVVLEGGPEPKRIVVLEFADLDAARRWYDSDLYREARAVREGAARGRFIAVEGV